MNNLERVPGFSERLRTKMQECGLNQSELANKLAVSRATVSNYLAERSEPTLTGLVSLSKILNTTPNQLLDVPDDSPVKESASALDPQEIVRRLTALENELTKVKEEVRTLKRSRAKQVDKPEPSNV